MTVSPVHVRPATSADEEAASSMADQVYAELRRYYRPTAMARAGAQSLKPSLQRLVALDDDRIVGTVKYYFHEGKLRVIGLAVDEQCRNRGVAQMLIDELGRLALEQGAHSLSAYTVPAAGAVPFYEKLGFRQVKECEEGYFESPDGVPMPEVLMERDV